MWEGSLSSRGEARRWLGRLLLALCMLCAAGCHFASLGHVTQGGVPAAGAPLSGVRVERGGQLVPTEAGMDLEKGDVISTGPHTTAVIEFVHGRALFMPNTRAQIYNPRIIEWFGEVFGFGPFFMENKHAVAAADSTSYVMASREGQTEVVVLSGTVRVWPRNASWQQRTLSAGERLVWTHETQPDFDQLTRAEVNRRLLAYGAGLGYRVMINVSGIDVLAARKELSKATIAVEREDERVVLDPNQEGLVLEQWPAAGGPARPAILTVGALGTPMPDVRNQTEAQARKTLADFPHLSFRQGYTGRSQAGLVIAQHPKPGTPVTTKRAIVLDLEGDPAIVPPLVGETQEEAERRLREAGLVLGRVTTEEARGQGLVLRQAKEQGTRVAPGSAVDIVVSVRPARAVAPADDEPDAPATTPADLVLDLQSVKQAADDGRSPPKEGGSNRVWTGFVDVRVTISNRGGTAVEAPFDIDVARLPGDDVLPIEQLASHRLSRLGANATETVSIRIHFTKSCRNCTLRIKVNERRTVPESNFKNNEAFVTVDVQSWVE